MPSSPTSFPSVLSTHWGCVLCFCVYSLCIVCCVCTWAPRLHSRWKAVWNSRKFESSNVSTCYCFSRCFHRMLPEGWGKSSEAPDPYLRCLGQNYLPAASPGSQKYEVCVSWRYPGVIQFPGLFPDNHAKKSCYFTVSAEQFSDDCPLRSYPGLFQKE